MKPIVLLALVLGGFFGTCSHQAQKNSDMERIGPDANAGLVVYFKFGTTEDQVQAFNHEFVRNPRNDGRGEAFINGIRGYYRLLPSQANGYDAVSLILHDDVTEEQRLNLKQSVESDETVYMVFRDTAPNEIKLPGESPLGRQNNVDNLRK